MQFKFDYDSPKGIRAIADHLDKLAIDPGDNPPTIRIGHARFYNSLFRLQEAAATLRSKAAQAGKKKSGLIYCPTPSAMPINPIETTFDGRNVDEAARRDEINRLHAVRVYGSPKAGLAAIRRQLAIQGEDMHPPDVKRCEKAADMIESHLADIQRETERQDEADALASRIEKARTPALDEILPEGTEVLLNRGYEGLRGVIVESITLKSGEARHKVLPAHRRYRGEWEFISPRKRRPSGRVKAHDIKVLPPVAPPAKLKAKLSQAKPETPELSPMMAEYTAMRKSLPADIVLLYRLGDFYEMFFEDARIAAPILNVALTKHNGTPMAGIPVHAAQSYIKRLIDVGKRVAIAEAVEPTRPGKLIEREVTQILSPEPTEADCF